MIPRCIPDPTELNEEEYQIFSDDQYVEEDNDMEQYYEEKGN